eukprot:Pgem_evm1s10566
MLTTRRRRSVSSDLKSYVQTPTTRSTPTPITPDMQLQISHSQHDIITQPKEISMIYRDAGLNCTEKPNSNHNLAKPSEKVTNFFPSRSNSDHAFSDSNKKIKTKIKSKKTTLQQQDLAALDSGTEDETSVPGIKKRNKLSNKIHQITSTVVPSSNKVVTEEEHMQKNIKKTLGKLQECKSKKKLVPCNHANNLTCHNCVDNDTDAEYDDSRKSKKDSSKTE